MTVSVNHRWLDSKFVVTVSVSSARDPGFEFLSDPFTDVK